MFQFKPISKEGIDEALKKAERYRLLNQPHLSESICQDILDIDPNNIQAIKTRLLATTDQFGMNFSIHINSARQLLSLLDNEYDREYYTGIIYERQGNAYLQRGRPGDHHSAYDRLKDAMEHYEKAESLRPQGQDDPILRWNTCARQIMSHNLKPSVEQYVEPPLE